MIDLCAAGDLNWLINLHVSRIPTPGEVTLIKSTEHLLGNDAAIVSLLAARLGLRCCLLATNAIATHDGQQLLDMLQQAGVDISRIDKGGSSTPQTIFLSHVDSDERAFLVEASAFHIPTDQFPASKFAYIDLYEDHIEDRLSLLERWSQANVRAMVNLSATALNEKIQSLARVSSVDTVQVGGSGSIDESRTLGRTILQQCKTRAAVITLGERGAVLVDEHDTSHIPAQPIQALRTMGAGASFAAGFLHALVQGATHQEACIAASQYAAMFCTLEKNPLEGARNIPRN